MMFELILLGHLVADYLLQPKKMAVTKSEKGIRGLMWCVLHCLIYTVIVSLFTLTFSPIIVTLIFLSHFPIDRWSLASKWLKMIKGRDFVETYLTRPEHYEIDLSFSIVVYTVVDNTLHLLLLWAIFALI
jgi:hypothetical protein